MLIILIRQDKTTHLLSSYPFLFLSIFIRLLAPKKCTKENLSVFSDAAPVIILHSPHIPYNKLLTTSSIYNKTPKKIFMGKSIPTFFQKKQRIIIPGTNRSGSNNLLRPPLISYKLSFSAYGQSFQQSPIERLSRCFSSHPKPIESPLFLEEKVFL